MLYHKARGVPPLTVQSVSLNALFLENTWEARLATARHCILEGRLSVDLLMVE